MHLDILLPKYIVNDMNLKNKTTSILERNGTKQEQCTGENKEHTQARFAQFYFVDGVVALLHL